MRLRWPGISHKRILEKVQRSRAGLSKWRKRFEQQGASGLCSHSRRPPHPPSAYAPRIVRLMVQTTACLDHQKGGWSGARAIRRELRKVLGQHAPSLTTLHRVLRTHNLVTTLTETPPAYFPKPLTTVQGTWPAMDGTCRYLEAGSQVYAFHTLNLRTRACPPTIAADQNGATVIRQGSHTWKTLGIPRFLQLDHAAVFCGGYKTPRLFGQFVRLCLYLGIELIFWPVAEPEGHGEVEELNGLWAHAFGERRRFSSFQPVCRVSPALVHWYRTNYAPPRLGHVTPAQAPCREPKPCLTTTQRVHWPDARPITAGYIPFLRKVKPSGSVSVFNETWQASKRLAGKYVWLTRFTHCRRLEIWYQRSAQPDGHLIKTFA